MPKTAVQDMDAVVDDSELAKAIYYSASPKTKARIQDQWRTIKAKRTREELDRRAAREKRIAKREREQERLREGRKNNGKFIACIGAVGVFVTIVLYFLENGHTEGHWVDGSLISMFVFMLAAAFYFDKSEEN
jgi:hypothetical protein